MYQKWLLLFCLLFTLFYGIGFLCLPQLSALPPASEVVFASFSLPAPRPFPILGGLPLAPSKDETPQKVTSATPSPTAVPPTPGVFQAEPAVLNGVLQIRNSAGYAFDMDALLSAPLSLLGDTPSVLIVHTHTSEAYTETPDYTYMPSDAYRTEDRAFNICRVGETLSKALRENGISVVHDTTSHDFPSYSGCYARSLETIEKNLANTAFDVVIDLHRDAISAPDGSYLKTKAEVDGKTAAQALVIVGTDAGGLAHPTWQDNLALGLRLQEKLCAMYPGLARPLHLRTERFNGHVSKGALLLEIGSNGNTMEEALYTATLVGNALSQMLLELPR